MKEADNQIINLLAAILSATSTSTGGSGSLTLPYTVTGALRIKSDGIYLYDSTTTKYHKLTAKGAANAVYLDIDQTGES
jgi:hypothetical protein